MDKTLVIDGVTVTPEALEVFRSWSLGKPENCLDEYVQQIVELQHFLISYASDSEGEEKEIMKYLANLNYLRRDLQQMITKEGGTNR